MTALAHEGPEATMSGHDLDEVLWQAWKAMELPEGFHAEIIEGSIEVSPTGRCTHGLVINRLRDKLVVHLAQSDAAARQDMNIIHGRKVWIPDLFIVPEDAEEHITDDGLGIKASAVHLVVEVASPGRDCLQRDRVRKVRAYARAGIPVYVIIDDYDSHGHVTVLTSPSPDEGAYADSTRRPYGTDVIISEGPAKGFVIGESVTGPSRSGS